MKTINMETKKDYIRTSALGHSAMGIYRVKVIFKDGGWDAKTGDGGDEIAYWMTQETYHSIPLGVVARVEDYKEHGELVEAKNTDIYDIENN